MFSASCASDEVIVIERAQFGRMRVGRCVEVDLGYIGCGADVRYILDEECSGKRECEVQVGDKNMKERSSCLKGLEQYLVANYTCREGNICSGSAIPGVH